MPVFKKMLIFQFKKMLTYISLPKPAQAVMLWKSVIKNRTKCRFRIFCFLLLSSSILFFVFVFLDHFDTALYGNCCVSMFLMKGMHYVLWIAKKNLIAKRWWFYSIPLQHETQNESTLHLGIISETASTILAKELSIL